MARAVTFAARCVAPLPRSAKPTRERYAFASGAKSKRTTASSARSAPLASASPPLLRSRPRADRPVARRTRAGAAPVRSAAAVSHQLGAGLRNALSAAARAFGVCEPWKRSTVGGGSSPLPSGPLPSGGDRRARSRRSHEAAVLHKTRACLERASAPRSSDSFASKMEVSLATADEQSTSVTVTPARVRWSPLLIEATRLAPRSLRICSSTPSGSAEVSITFEQPPSSSARRLPHKASGSSCSSSLRESCHRACVSCTSQEGARPW
mmetsp:Transcript_40434/g.132089  ORF Transcript_40434/g.132089 Transcript_40434/m.132089 type:complete len:266 (+) Transcript_40434:274-1071(+)